MQRIAQINTGLLAVLCLAGSLSSQAFAQATDTEPNNTCPVAQDIGAIHVNTPFTVVGSLDTPPEVPDVDFFRFSATPSASLIADLGGEDTGQFTLPDPLLGLFDSGCILIDFNDDTGNRNSRLQFVVPADGVVILAATSSPDRQFVGAGNTSGTYELTVSPAPPPPPTIGSIAGRVIDAATGEPLFGTVVLLHCDGTGCFDVNAASTDDEGRFLFTGDFVDAPLPVGTYQVTARVDGFEFEPNVTAPFDVAEGEDFDVGDIALARPPISISDIQPCEDLQGGRCLYSVTVRTNRNAPVQGLAWSMVNGSGLGSDLTVTLFEATTAPPGGSRQVIRARVAVDPSSEQVIHFRFRVPRSAVGATFCPQMFFGVNPNPLVNTVNFATFCITASATGFEVMSESESQKLFRSRSGRTEMLRKVPAAKPLQQPTK